MIILYYLLCALAGFALVHAGLFIDSWEWWAIVIIVPTAYAIGHYCGRKEVKEENNNENR